MEKFVHKKSLGQNFLKDVNLLDAIVTDSGVNKDSYVLEIGAGQGALTSSLAKKVKKVVAVETDARLIPFLKEKFINNKNVEIWHEDFMKIAAEDINVRMQEKFAVVANLPYYITTPILFRFFEDMIQATSLTIMVQKEVGERIVAKPNSKEYGILSVQCQSFAHVKIVRQVGRQNFTPVPNVDSCVVKLEFKNVDFDKKSFSRFVRDIFQMRRKTIVNNLKAQYTKERVEQALNTFDRDLNTRAEQLSVEELQELFKNLQK